MDKTPQQQQQQQQQEDADECENTKLTDCYFDKKDWRACTAEMEQFRQCWRRNGNDKRTSSRS
ncbi:hypothetical protein L249_2603 [Ophiocordyceps polyrhachis-furcata BCC 54312]|uniref:CHCH domain-containing protein n=1 Tax=Ophiocordyceps polyrhachis-furcata BCC 54312 TaxID=1330021 RepID=A0A367LPQ3_9HYPO|nr:hypothetical protein L249_2603 [Ophiocordyceps polyrhachis-furcata BCC 54312]